MRQEESDLYASLPADGEQAFLIIEKFYRDEADAAIHNARQDDNIDIFYVDYIAKVLAAMSELSLDAHFITDVPEIENVSYQTYLNFSKDVRHYCTRLEIRHARRAQGYSVRFDTAAREKIRHFLKQVRDVVERLEIGQDKRDRLFKKIGALELEIDRVRTPLDAFGDLIIEAADDVGEAADRLGPVRKLLDSVAKVFHGTRADNEEEDQKRLPPPMEQKRIEPPRHKPAQPKKGSDFGQGGFSREIDDEIPF